MLDLSPLLLSLGEVEEQCDDDAADEALRGALRVHPALAQKLELQYLRSGPAQPLAHLRRAVEVLRAVDDHQLAQVSAAEAEALPDVLDDGPTNHSTVGAALFPSLPLPDSFCPAGRRREDSSTMPRRSLRPPLPDRELGGECKRIGSSQRCSHV